MTVILLLLAWRSKSRLLIWFVFTLFLLMCLATVYIRAHYVIDVFAGLLSAIIMYITLHYICKYRRI